MSPTVDLVSTYRGARKGSPIRTIIRT